MRLLSRYAICYALVWLWMCCPTSSGSIDTMGLPTFFVDPKVEEILVGNRQSCFHSTTHKLRSALTEVEYLKSTSATEFYRSHELFAHHYFIEMGSRNALRRYNYNESELEYIPLLPLHWSARLGTTECSYKGLIASILKVQEYIEFRDGQIAAAQSPNNVVLPTFTVSSTFNLRTELGAGMPTQVRKGAAWDSVMRFIMRLTVGHYERWPQCPDLLRKSPKLNTELPYVTTTSDSIVTSIAISSSTTPAPPTITTSAAAANIERTKKFFYSGNFALFGPEMVCSVRNEILSLSSRADSVILNSTMADAVGPLRLGQIAHWATRSVFCLVAKGDSYSTSFFYAALRYGCIPIVISDWFVFAFPWVVPYEQFVLRVREEDFLLNPSFVLDYIANNIATQQGMLLQMREAMVKYAPLLSFDKVQTGSQYHHSLLSHDRYLHLASATSTSNTHSTGSTAATKTATTVTSKAGAEGAYTYLPLELMLLEVRYSQQPHQYYNSIPCLRPYMCSDTHLPNRSYTPLVTEYTFPAKSKVRSIDVTYSANHMSKTHKVGYSTVNDGYQVKGLFLPAYDDQRTHLCRHSSRLIGSYKIVFFMQCVRILWPLQPGTFKPVDNTQRFTVGFDNKTQVIARYKGGRYPVEPDGISARDMRFVSVFHNATKPPDWVLTNYPVSFDASKIVAFA